MEENIISRFINNIFQDRNLSGNSTRWANWMSKLSKTSCQYCVEKHGTIVDISILNYKTNVEAHIRCKCVYVPMRTIKAGTATTMGYSGADAVLFYLKRLPDYYVDKKTARKYGWKDWKGNLSEALPKKMIGGDVYNNKNNKLPQKSGRMWYEADINYDGGYRNRERVLYSNDGLVFVTLDHYQTFYEVVQ